MTPTGAARPARPRRAAPVLIAMAGLPCSGKSAVATELAAALHATHLEVDAVEDAVVRSGIARSFETGLAGYLVSEALARAQLEARRAVVIDAANYVEGATARGATSPRRPAPACCGSRWSARTGTSTAAARRHATAATWPDSNRAGQGS